MENIRVTTWKRTVRIIIADLRLFASLYVAHFLVRRTLAARRKAAHRDFKKSRKKEARRRESQSEAPTRLI